MNNADMSHLLARAETAGALSNILFVISSPRGWQSHSHRFASHIVDDLKCRHPAAKVQVRDVAREPLPHIDAAFVSGRALPPAERNPAQARALALSDALIDELEAADVIVLAVPMHNFGIPSSLKAWIDHVVVPKRTFSYAEHGSVGLLRDKRAVLVLARGGTYAQGASPGCDFQEPYLRAVLGFIGITDIQVVRVEGVGLGQAALTSATRSAQAQALEVLREFA